MMLAIYVLASILIIAAAQLFIGVWGNPITFFVGSWLTIVLLYQFRLSKHQSALSDDTYGLLLIVVASFTLAFSIGSFFSLRKRKTHTVCSRIPNEIDENRVIHLFYIWSALSIFEIVYSGGVPLLWMLLGVSKNYADFGVPSLHGFLNALGLAILTLSFYLTLKQREGGITRIKVVVFTIMTFYVMLITRQVLISAVIQMVIVFVLIKKDIPWRFVIPIVFFGILLFGFLGNVRTGYETFLRASMIENASGEWASGLYWIYMYTTMTLANVNQMVSMHFDFVGFQAMLNDFLPTVFSKVIIPDPLPTPYILVSQYFTVSGFFITSYFGFGSVGVAFMSGAYGLLSAIAYKNLRREPGTLNIIIYAVILQIVLLSFFVNMLLYLPNVFQLVIICWFFRKKAALSSRQKYLTLKRTL